jgi:hypothetical protein
MTTIRLALIFDHFRALEPENWDRGLSNFTVTMKFQLLIH